MKKKNFFFQVLVVMFFPIMIIGAVCASVKVAYKCGHLTATDFMQETIR